MAAPDLPLGGAFYRNFSNCKVLLSNCSTQCLNLLSKQFFFWRITEKMAVTFGIFYIFENWKWEELWITDHKRFPQISTISICISLENRVRPQRCDLGIWKILIFGKLWNCCQTQSHCGLWIYVKSPRLSWPSNHFLEIGAHVFDYVNCHLSLSFMMPSCVESLEVDHVKLHAQAFMAFELCETVDFGVFEIWSLRFLAKIK